MTYEEQRTNGRVAITNAIADASAKWGHLEVARTSYRQGELMEKFMAKLTSQHQEGGSTS